MRRFLVVAAALMLGACASAPAPDASGAEIYLQLCARCHGADLQGGTGPPMGAGSALENRPDEYLVTVITRGQGRMPGFGGTLSDEQVLRVVNYIREQQASG